MIGYKVFNTDWTCREFQFEVGKIFEEDVKPVCCERGFHFCTKASDCFSYYSFDPNNKFAEVEAFGDIDNEEDDTKHCTNKIKIIREIEWQELLELVNSGTACTGLCNTGDYNSGDYNTGDKNTGDKNSGDKNSGDKNSGNKNSGNKNTGDYNTGNCNSGDYNTGDKNTGDKNSGNKNTGYYNSGDYNSGNCNSGNMNSGNYNSGYYNSGDYNSGDYNSGNRNTGDYNTGNMNSGYYNTGDYNSGDYNSGNYNSGDCNSGNWNKTSNAVGCFNTEEQKLKFFDKETDMTFHQWGNSNAKYLLDQIDFRPTEWINLNYMTDEEKLEHPEYETTGGYLKFRDNTYYRDWETDRKSTRLNSSHSAKSRMPSSA